MNGYTCIKACALGGTAYEAGDNIPAEVVLPSRVRALTRQGYITPQTETAAMPTETPPGEPPAPAPITVPITKDGGVLELPVAPDGIIQAVAILQLKAEEAAAAAAEVDSEEVLILIDALETRKTVKTALAARAEELNKSEEDDGDGQGGEQQPGSKEPEGVKDQGPIDGKGPADGDGEGQEGQKQGDA